ncbi:MAG: glycoside hydrolase domain-containing protein [Gammaproteobacteria bacterium]
MKVLLNIAALICVAPIGQSRAGTGELAWLDSQLGREEVVLPGFAPVRVSGTRIELGAARIYDWSGGALPVAIDSGRQRVLDSMELVAVVGGVATTVRATPQVVVGVDHHAEIQADSTSIPGVAIKVHTRVEYDGVAVVDVDLAPGGAVTLDSLTVRMTVPRNRDMKAMGFDPATVYSFQPDFVPECYRGPYKNAIGFAYPAASFWWFADVMDKAALGADPQTIFECAGDSIRVTQPLVAKRQRLNSPRHFQFAFLATPVRELGGDFRRDRYTSRNATEEGNRNLWWIDATAHYALPSLEYPPGAKARLTPGDVQAYPGAAANAASVLRARRQGMERFPYTSLRSLSFLDPEIGTYEQQWMVSPRRDTTPGSDNPYRIGYARALLSLRAPGFADYLLTRLSSVADGIKVRGFYFDQALPVGSTNPAQLPPGAAAGSAATDILAMRSFFKRLATMLYLKTGEAPLIYAHNTSGEVIPAFTFVTGMVQGEDSTHLLKNLDYQGTFDLDTVRSTYSPGAFGIPTIWLEELWSDALVKQRPLRYMLADSADWLASPDYHRAWRNFMALAVIHDIPVWTLAPLADRQEIYRRLYRFGVADSRFVGYWDLTRAWRDSPMLASAYVHEQTGRVLLVLANRGTEPRQLDSGAIASLLNPGVFGPRAGAASAPLNFGTGKFTILGRDFLLVESR